MSSFSFNQGFIVVAKCTEIIFEFLIVIKVLFASNNTEMRTWSSERIPARQSLEIRKLGMNSRKAQL